MNIFRVAKILQSLHMLKGSTILTDAIVLESLLKNFKYDKELMSLFSLQDASKIYQYFYDTYTEGGYTEALMRRDERRRFYLSKEWLDLRKLVYKRDKHVCVDCGSKTDLSCDHIISRHKDRSLELDINNICIRCLPCNLAKGSK